MNDEIDEKGKESDEGKTVSLVLGSGGARGLAHIGAIQALIENGFEIRSIAGSSMGALVGGIYAAGKLDEYRDWVCSLEQSDVLKLVDWTLSGSGLIRGKRIIGKLREIVGDVDIEDLDVDFTAVCVDIEQGREIWLSRGPLFDAIRGSIAIPGLFTPHRYQGRLLVDGGILNPVPVAPTLRSLNDLTVVINVNSATQPVRAGGRDGAESETAGDDADRGVIERIRDFFGGIVDRDPTSGDADDDPGIVAMLIKSLETMESVITRQHLAVFQPDLVVEISKEACMIHEFDRAEELIELGYRRTIRALENRREQRDG